MAAHHDQGDCHHDAGAVADKLRNAHAEYRRRRSGAFVQQVERALSLAVQNGGAPDHEARLQVAH